MHQGITVRLAAADTDPAPLPAVEAPLPAQHTVRYSVHRGNAAAAVMIALTVHDGIRKIATNHIVA